MALTPNYPTPPYANDPSNDRDEDLVLDSAQLVGLVTSEKIKYEMNSAEMRTILRKIYRNFMGIFDEPRTRYTNRLKEFWHLTQYHTLASAGRIYVDPRAITILPRTEEDKTKAKVWGDLIPFQLRQIGFFQKMNDFSIDLSLFGTVVSVQDWNFKRTSYAEPITGPDGEDKVITKDKVTDDELSYKVLPILSVYTDMTADNLQVAPSVIIETWHEVSELPALKAKYGWKVNVDDVRGLKLITNTTGKQGKLDILDYQQMGITQKQLEVPMVQLLWRWAKIRLSYVTKKKADRDTWVEGRIVVLSQAQQGEEGTPPMLMEVSLNPFKHGKRPFEECWYIKIPGRWYGLGNGEMQMYNQTYLNRLVNQRTDNAEIIQNKMWKARRGSGLDSRSIASAPGKVITVQNMDDLEPLEVSDLRASSYEDEQNVLLWAERLSHVKDASSDAKTATEAQINEQLAGDFFAIVRRNINDYLKRVIVQFVELDKQFIEQGLMVRIVGQPGDFEDIDSMMGYPEPIRKDLGNMRFMQIDDIREIDGDFDIEVDIDNSVPMNKAFMVSSLEKFANMALMDPDSGINRREVYKEWAQNIGLKGSRFFLNTNNQSYMGMPGAQQMGAAMGGASPEGANVPGVPTNTGMEGPGARPGTPTMFESGV